MILKNLSVINMILRIKILKISLKIGGILIANKLSKTLIKKFSISYSEATRLGIIDEDLKYISETATNTFRVSVPNPYGKRKTKVEHNILDAIHTKYDFIKEIQNEGKIIEEKNKTLEDSKKEISKFNTVREGIGLYMRERKQDLERGFIQDGTYEQDVIDFEKSNYLKNSKLLDEIIADVDIFKAQAYVNYLYDIKTKNGKRLSENTIYKPYSFIRKVFNYFKNDLLIIDSNPFDRVKNKPHAVAKNKEYFTEEEMHFIHDKVELENIRFRTLIVLMLDSGMRREEALGLKFSDINKVRKTLTISRAYIKSKINNKDIVKPTKTKSSLREIALTSHSLDLLDKYRLFKEACGFVITEDDYIFTAWDSLDLIDPSRFSMEFKKFLKKININKVIPLKNLRTTNTTFFVAKGQNLKAIQKHEGHSTFDTTMTFYAQSNLTEERKLANVYEEEFYNKLGLSVAEIYKIVSNRFNDNKKLVSVLEKICNVEIDSLNYDFELERCKEYFKELFPIFNKILKIDSLLNDEEIDALFVGYTSTYLSIKIEPLEPTLKI